MNQRLFYIAAFLWLVPYAALAEDMASAADNRIKVLVYDEADVYTITTKYGYQTNIVFSPNEEIQTISIGDRSLWQILPSSNRIFIRPMDEGVTTNMTVLTNKHSYQFDLKSLAADDKEGNNIYVAKFSYPSARPKNTGMMPPPVPAPPMAMAPPASVAAPMDTAPQYPNYNYTYSGPDTLAPLQVFDNGKSTFIKYQTMPNPLPETVVVDTNGQERAVAHQAQDHLLIIDTVAGTLAIKHSEGTITVYNEMLNPQ